MFATPAYAQAADAAGAGGFLSGPMGTLLFFLPLFVLFWFLMIRPQQRRMKEHQAQIAAVKKGDRVVTGGGLIGKVTKVGDSEVEVELGPNVRVTAVKSTLTQVGNPAAAKPAND